MGWRCIGNYLLFVCCYCYQQYTCKCCQRLCKGVISFGSEVKFNVMFNILFSLLNWFILLPSNSHMHTISQLYFVNSMHILWHLLIPITLRTVYLLPCLRFLEFSFAPQLHVNVWSCSHHANLSLWYIHINIVCVVIVDPQLQVTGHPSFQVTATNAQANTNLAPLRGVPDHQIQFKFNTAGNSMDPPHLRRKGRNLACTLSFPLYMSSIHLKLSHLFHRFTALCTTKGSYVYYSM